jgi:hypothetical protein
LVLPVEIKSDITTAQKEVVGEVQVIRVEKDANEFKFTITGFLSICQPKDNNEPSQPTATYTYCSLKVHRAVVLDEKVCSKSIMLPRQAMTRSHS